MARGQAMGGWWREPPWWAWVFMVVGAVFLAVGLPIAWNRGQVSQSQLGQIEQTGQPAVSVPATASTTEAPARRVVAIGDDFTAGSGEGGSGNAAWPALLEERLPDIAVDVAAADGAGYVVPSPSTGQTFPQLASAAPIEDAAVVIVFGSRNDGPGIADRVGTAARETFDGIRSRAPDAQLIVIGPPWVNSDVPAGVVNNRGTIREAAQAVGATFVDPLADGWFVGQPDLIGSDGALPTDAGHAYLADVIEPSVRQVLGS